MQNELSDALLVSGHTRRDYKLRSRKIWSLGIVAIAIELLFGIAANKDHADLEKKYQQLQRQNSSLQSQVQEKEQKLQKLRTGKVRNLFIFIRKYDY